MTLDRLARGVRTRLGFGAARRSRDPAPTEPASAKLAPTGPASGEPVPVLPTLTLDYLGRTRLPPPGEQPAVVVPFDYDDVVPIEKPREPYETLARIFHAALTRTRDFRQALEPHYRMLSLLATATDEVTPHWDNPHYGAMDGRLLYAIVRHVRPARIIEIGSGNSTKFMRRAITDARLTTRITSIDPEPRTQIEALVDEVHRTSAVRLPPDFFDVLTAGDVLFIDGSHLALHGTDVPYLFLRVLPRLARGVLVHVHDIYLPDEYPPACDRLYWGEQYVLGALLLDDARWEAIVPTHFLFRTRELPADGCSMWIRRRT